MSTTANNERQVYVIIDGLERGPYEYRSFVRDVHGGFPGPDVWWRFSDETDYHPVQTILKQSQTTIEGESSQHIDESPNPSPPPRRWIKKAKDTVATVAIGVFLLILAVHAVFAFSLWFGPGRKLNHRVRQYAAPEQIDNVFSISKFLYNSTSEFRLERNQNGRCRIRGFVTNGTGRVLRYATIEFGVYSENGSKIDSASDSITDLGVLEVWEFDIPAGISKSVGSVKLTNIDGMH